MVRPRRLRPEGMQRDYTKTNAETAMAKEDYVKFISEVRKASGIEALTPDESGLVSVRVDDKYNVNLQFVETTGDVLCFIEVMALPPDTPKAVYRDLLAGGLFGKDTAGGYFSLEPETETVVFNYLFDLANAANDVEDFIRSLEKILQLCDVWFERIRENMAADGCGENAAASGEPPMGHTIFRA